MHKHTARRPWFTAWWMGALATAGMTVVGCVNDVDTRVARPERAVAIDGDAVPVGVDDRVDVDDADVDDTVDDDVDNVDDAPPLAPWDTARSFNGIVHARMVGAIGPARGFDATADIVQLYDAGSYTELALYAPTPGGRRVMVQVQLQSLTGAPLFQPGVGKRYALGYGTTANVAALACEGPDSGDSDNPFADTPFDEEPCSIGVDAERDPENPDDLNVTLAVAFADDNGDCDADGDGFDDDLGDGFDGREQDLPDVDGDGDGDLGGCDDASGGDFDGDGSVDDGDGTVQPLSTAQFRLTR